jgi:hypothetical protein
MPEMRVAPLGDARCLAAQATQVIEFGPAHLAAAHDLDAFNQRRVNREHALHPLAIGDLAHGEAFLQAVAAARDAHALKRLNALAVALDDAHIHAHRIARLERRDAALLLDRGGLLPLDFLNDVHGSKPSAAGRAGRAAASYRFRHMHGKLWVVIKHFHALVDRFANRV